MRQAVRSDYRPDAVGDFEVANVASVEPSSPYAQGALSVRRAAGPLTSARPRSRVGLQLAQALLWRARRAAHSGRRAESDLALAPQSSLCSCRYLSAAMAAAGLRIRPARRHFGDARRRRGAIALLRRVGGLVRPAGLHRRRRWGPRPSSTRDEVVAAPRRRTRGLPYGRVMSESNMTCLGVGFGSQ